MKPMASVNYNFVQKLPFWNSKKKSQQENKVSYQSNESENIMTEIQKILIWDDPSLSCCCLVFVNIVFWLIVYLDLKLYGVIFIILLILSCEQLWTEFFSRSVNTDNPNFLMQCSSKSSNQRMFDCSEENSFFKKALKVLNDVYIRAKHLRQSQPGLFCILTCLCFLLIGVIGKSFSGLTSFYLLLMAVMTIPGAVVRLLPPEVIKSFSEVIYFNQKGDNDSEDEIEPYLLDTNEEALELLKMAGDLKLPNKEDDEESNDLLFEHLSERTNDTTESVCSKFSLYPESTVMPSPENSMDYWESDSNFWEKTESDNTKGDVNFQSQHSDDDSSEEEFVKGLDLSEETIKKNKKDKTQEKSSTISTENLILAGKKILETKSKSINSSGSEKESSSDTDSFEMISEGDM